MGKVVATAALGAKQAPALLARKRRPRWAAAAMPQSHAVQLAEAPPVITNRGQRVVAAAGSSSLLPRAEGAAFARREAPLDRLAPGDAPLDRRATGEAPLDRLGEAPAEEEDQPEVGEVQPERSVARVPPGGEAPRDRPEERVRSEEARPDRPAHMPAAGEALPGPHGAGVAAL